MEPVVVKVVHGCLVVDTITDAPVLWLGIDDLIEISPVLFSDTLVSESSACFWCGRNELPCKIAIVVGSSNVSSSDDRLSRKLEVAMMSLVSSSLLRNVKLTGGSRQSWSHQEGLVLPVGFDMGSSHWIFRVRNGAGSMAGCPETATPGGCSRFAVDLGSGTH